jgi:8-oxo-dGTP pyrophosphatase MutT (NUDIX family)
MTILKHQIIPSPKNLDNFEFTWILSPQVDQPSAIATVGVFVLNDQDQLLLSQHPTRGWQIPGGHIETGENPIQAARREVAEEAAATIENVVSIGYLSMTLLAPKPEGYKYPYPTRICQFFAAKLMSLQDFHPIADAQDRGLFDLSQVEHLSQIYPELINDLLFYPAARNALHDRR